MSIAASVTRNGMIYKAWQRSMLPERMREKVPLSADYVVVRELDGTDMIGYIQESDTRLQPFTCSAQGSARLSDADTLVGAFMRIVSAAENGASPAGTAALVIHPRGDVTEISLTPGVSNLALKRKHLGRYLITRVALTSRLDMWFGADAEDTQPVNFRATTLARSYGFIWRVYHGPVMLCCVDGMGAAASLTREQVLRMFTSQPMIPEENDIYSSQGAGGATLNGR
jgi:Domain of unknown function (DUF3846)